MQKKNIGKVYKREYNLDKALCESDPKVQSAEYTDHYINGVTYRVWSAFEGKTNAADSLSRVSRSERSLTSLKRE